MNIDFRYSYLAEYRKLIYNLYNLETGFYKNAGMFLSYSYLKSPNIVVLPTFGELRSQSFWKRYKGLKKDIPSKYWGFNGKEFSDLFVRISGLGKVDCNDLMEKWRKVSSGFEVAINTLFDSNLFNVNVYITYFGSIASYNHAGNSLNIYLRKDADISQIAFCILSYFVHEYKGKLTWNEEQRAVDFLLLNTTFRKLFPGFKSVLDFVDDFEIGTDLILSSWHIYKDLGLIAKNTIKIKNDKIYINEKELETLTKHESLVFLQMIKNKNEVTTFEQISTLIWGDDYSSFSLQAIAKIIERIRQKILHFGLYRQIIFTKRKEGYMLYD